MPIYEYECDKCKKVHEIWQKMSDDPIKTCPSCRGKVHRLISASGFQLKGSGWYVTDYQRKGTSSEKKTEGAKGESKSESKSEKSSGKSKKKDEPAAHPA